MKYCEKEQLIRFIDQKCPSHLKEGKDGLFFGWPIADVKMAIAEFEPEPTEGCTCKKEHIIDDNESLVANLQKELNYWKNEARSRHDDIIRMTAIIRTIEQITGKTFID